MFGLFMKNRVAGNMKSNFIVKMRRHEIFQVETHICK